MRNIWFRQAEKLKRSSAMNDASTAAPDWYADFDGETVSVQASGGGRIATVTWLDGHWKRRSAGEVRRNAYLLAASPELLFALEQLRIWCIPGMTWRDEIGQNLLAIADAAINAARGEQP
jgi:hypothetical protein